MDISFEIRRTKVTEWSMAEVIKMYIKDCTGTAVRIVVPEQQRVSISRESYKNLIAGMDQAYNAACHYYFNKGY